MENMPLCRHFKFLNQQGEGKSNPLIIPHPYPYICVCVGEKIKRTTNKHGLVKLLQTGSWELDKRVS